MPPRQSALSCSQKQRLGDRHGQEMVLPRRSLARSLAERDSRASKVQELRADFTRHQRQMTLTRSPSGTRGSRPRFARRRSNLPARSSSPGAVHRQIEFRFVHFSGELRLFPPVGLRSTSHTHTHTYTTVGEPG